jgi:hypothetical protein
MSIPKRMHRYTLHLRSAVHGALLLLVLLSTAVAQASSTNLVVDPAQSNKDLGLYNDLAIDSNGFPVIAYYNTTDEALFLKRCLDVDCTTSNQFEVESGTGLDLGVFVSLDLSANDTPVMAYREAVNGELRLARCDTPLCSNLSGGMQFLSVVSPNAGAGLDLAIDRNLDEAYIVYRDGNVDSTATLELKQCDVDPANALSCASTSVEIADSAAVGTRFNYPSLALAQPTPGVVRPLIAYLKDTPATTFDGDLELVICDDSACNSPSRFQLDGNPTNPVAGLFNQVTFDGTRPLVSYVRFNGASPGVYVASCPTLDCTTINTNLITTASRSYTSIGLANGLPVVSYLLLGVLDAAASTCGDAICATSSTDPFLADTIERTGFSMRLAITPSTAPTPEQVYMSFYRRGTGNPALQPEFDELILYRPGNCFARNTTSNLQETTFNHEAIQNIIQTSSLSTIETVQTAGTCVGTDDYSGAVATETISVNRDIVLQGGYPSGIGIPDWTTPSAATRTVLDADASASGNRRVVTITNFRTDVTLDKFIIQNGNVTGTEGGGGVFNSTNPNIVISDSIIQNNTAQSGGGVFNNEAGEMTLSNVQILNNTARRDGGGLVNLSGVVTLETGSVVDGNLAGNTGGGIFSNSYFGDSTLTIDASTVSNNSTDDSWPFPTNPFFRPPAYLGGGGIFNTSFAHAAVYDPLSPLVPSVTPGQANVIIRNGSSVNDNEATTFGGGVHNYGYDTRLEVLDSEFFNNRAGVSATASGLGGGIANHRLNVGSTAEVVIERSDIRQNVVGSIATLEGGGGGLYNFEGSVEISETSIEANQAAQGGGILNVTSQPNAKLEIVRSSLSINIAQTEGGGMISTGGPSNGVVLENVTVSANLARDEDGGGLYIFTTSPAGDFFANFVTVNNNEAPNGDGDGIYNDSTAGSFSFTNSLVNDGCNAGIPIADDGGSFDSGTSCGLTNSNANILLGVLTTNALGTQSHELQAGSDGVDAAQAACPTVLGAGTLNNDQRGSARPIDGDAIPGAICDAGAYERP